MRTSRFYTRQALADGETVALDRETSHYITRVLRLRDGDTLVLFDGSGRDYHATVASADKKQVLARIRSSEPVGNESALQIELGQGVSRGERMDFVLQKSVELGVNTVTPLWTRRSQVRLQDQRLEKRLAHWQGVMRAACEQSGRSVLPALQVPCGLADWCAGENSALQLVLDPVAETGLRDLQPVKRVRILVGPEGGLEEQEMALAVSAGFQPVRLGPRVLRTETAALATLSAVQALWGDLAG
ncbi:MAG TPA: 16S rRNA (uracil(1498)-N(3))-methyltransferase [Gammaproteobacteria bacterium]|nr:16S rRNA (uracil(1498)-N(3))-methyltransferase [Gammaproteobacteria bacterium]